MLSKLISTRSKHTNKTIIRVSLRIHSSVWRDGRVVERRTVSQGTVVQSQFRSPHICRCLSEYTLKAGGPFCLVAMPGEVKYPTLGVNM